MLGEKKKLCALMMGFFFVFCFPPHDHLFRSVWKHLRGLSMCLLLLVFPVFLAYEILQFFHMDFWLLILVAGCMLTSLQVGPDDFSHLGSFFGVFPGVLLRQTHP